MKLIKNKKGLGMVLVTTIVIILVSAIVVYSVTGRLISQADKQLQSEICRFQMIGSHARIDEGKDASFFSWQTVETRAIRNLLKSPLCTTQNEIFDLRKVKDEDLAKEVGIRIGNMMAKCWKTFAEGQIPNTFGQTVTATREDVNNYYFPCYNFKFLMPKNTNTVLVSDLQDFGGILWDYNLKGRKIPPIAGLSGDLYYEEIQKRYIDYGDQDYLSYGGYIVWQNYGDFEFAESITEKINWGVILSPRYTYFQRMIRNHPIMFAISTYKRAGARTIIPGTSTLLEKISSDQYYEVRYYPAFTHHEENSYAINSIRIVPVDESGRTSRISGTTER